MDWLQISSNSSVYKIKSHRQNPSRMVKFYSMASIETGKRDSLLSLDFSVLEQLRTP
jgi:hypothetical protein